MNISGSKAIPITILTGFLGAGKTTLLNRILSGNHGLRVAVLVNDFGAVNVDAALVVGVQDDVISLANGCVCCTTRGDLIETVVATINRPEAPEYILLEASGVADPSGIATTFVNPGLRERIRLDSVTCVVDTEQVFAHPDRPDVMALKLRQVAFSDMAILNKVDLASPEQVKKVRAWIDDNFRRRRIIETNHCDVPLEILLSVGRFDPARPDFGQRALHDAGCIGANCQDEHHHHDHHHDHSKIFSTWSYETDRPLSLKALREAAGKLPSNIYRCKGVINTSDTPGRPTVLQVVGRRVDISMQDEWGGRVPRTQIVTIGAADGIDAKLLEQTFAACAAVRTDDRNSDAGAADSDPNQH